MLILLRNHEVVGAFRSSCRRSKFLHSTIMFIASRRTARARRGRYWPPESHGDRNMTRTANEPLRMAVQRLRRSVIREGKPFPLGATWDGVGVNFALFSAHATRVELCLFDEKGDRELERVDLPEYTDEVWHGYLPNARPGTVYGYRVHGPFEPDVGHRFNPNKLLLDPYADH